MFQMDGVVSTPARNTESWTDEDSDGKSLWFRRDGLTAVIEVRLMARTKNPPVSLILPLDNCFEVRILRVDNAAGCVFVRPVEEENLFHELQAQLASWSPKWAVPIDIEFLNEGTIFMICSGSFLCAFCIDESDRLKNAWDIILRLKLMVRLEKIYLASDGDEVFRGALIGQPLDKSLLYGIDIGQTRFVDKENICGLPAQLQPIPPLCFCGLLPTGATSEEVIELSMLDIESTYLCKIYKMLPPFFMDHPTSTMPPVLFIQLYKLTGEKNKYVEVVFSERHNMVAAAIEQLFAEHMAFHNSLMAPEICGQQFEEETANAFQEPSQSLNDVQANGDGSSVELKDFQFKQFSAVVPCQVKAIVTERIRYDMYWMRDLEILSNVFESMVNPVEPLANNSYKGEVSCIVRLARPFRSKHVLDRFCVYR
ncbi:unnamed protein product [Gongylonema pulchrum]|uniref:Tudor domain-containing protein n=1 Tax=Gongylonema pulchrum TaxID=637853 RepID=A0A183CUR6_9BILA|nr:unnamed protein product [Gongylonema pulchrum]